MLVWGHPHEDAMGPFQDLAAAGIDHDTVFIQGRAHGRGKPSRPAATHTPPPTAAVLPPGGGKENSHSHLYARDSNSAASITYNC